MKLIGWLFAALLLLAAPAQAGQVGFQEVRVADGADRPLVVGIWYPTEAAAVPTPLATFTQTVAPGGRPAGQGLGLVTMSHGTGGWYGGHFDTALALAKAGFVVAAVSHTGDTYDDHSRAIKIGDRARQLKRVTDYMLAEWPDRSRIDPARVGVFGFSAGGFTALVAAGGVPDFGRTAAHCLAHPDYFDCQLLKTAGVPYTVGADVPASAWIHDGRIKAAVVAAPALGNTFGVQGLKNVRVPLQLWRAEYDHILPHPDYAEAVRTALPTAPDFHLVANADHFDFLSPCDDRLRRIAPEICASRPGFDRVAFHESFNAAVVRFFQEALK